MGIEEVKKLIGANIRRLRLDKGLTQEALAEKIDLHFSYVGLVERGEKSPSLQTLHKIAIFFNISIADLFNISEDKRDDVCLKKRQLLNILKGRSLEELDKLLRIAEILFE